MVGIAALIWLWAGAPPAAGDSWTWPVRGEVVTAYANAGGPYAAGQHRGIDVAARRGAPVVAAAGGSVRFAGLVGSSGVTVAVRTADGRFDTSYLHLATATVRTGQAVAPGDRIGTIGVSGRRSTAASHLHFGVRDAGTRRYRDPLDLLPPLPGVRDAPRGVPVAVRGPVRVGPAPQPVRGRRAALRTGVPAVSVPAQVPRWAGDRARAGLGPAVAPRRAAAAASRPGWAVACGALVLAAVLLGDGAPARRRLRSTVAWLRLSFAGR